MSTEDAQIAAFKQAWEQADREGDVGNRVRRGLAAARSVPPEKPRYRIAHGWLVQEVDEHTCGFGGPEGHEPECGLIPELRLNNLPGWPATPTRQQIEDALAGVLWNASNHPNPVAVLGQDIGPLRKKCVDAVMEALR